MRTYEVLVAGPFVNVVAAQVTTTVNPLSAASVRLNVVLAAQLPIDGVYVCYHDNADNCDCRKPKPGMLLTAAAEKDLTPFKARKGNLFTAQEMIDSPTGRAELWLREPEVPPLRS